MNKYISTYWIIALILSVIILFNNFGVTNDGRHYLSAAESLKSNGIYTCLGYSSSFNNLIFLVDWPPIYPAFIALVALIFKISVYSSAKLLHLFLFLFTAHILDNFKLFSNYLKITALILIFNSSNYTCSNAEVFLIPVFFVIYKNLDKFLINPFLFGAFIGVLYLMKYTFIFMFPVVLIFIIWIRIKDNLKGLDIKNVILVLKWPIMLYTIGYFLIFLIWHICILTKTGNFFPGFIGVKVEVDFLQFFRDLVITWNLVPERFENSASLLGVATIFVVFGFLAVKVISNIKSKLYGSNIYWLNLILFFGWLSFLILETYLHGISTKRYIEGSELLLLFILVSPEMTYGERYTRVIISCALFFQTLFLFNGLRHQSLNAFSVKVAFGNKMVINDINNKLDADTVRIYGFDKSLMSGLVEMKHWDRISELDTTAVGNKKIKVFPEGSLFLIQKIDKIKSLDKELRMDSSRLFYFNR